MKQVVFLSQAPEQSVVGKNSTFYHNKSLAWLCLMLDIILCVQMIYFITSSWLLLVVYITFQELEDSTLLPPSFTST